MKSHYYVFRVGHTPPEVKHDTVDEAVKESERLANKHPGKEFEILQCIGVTKAITTQTTWTDDAVVRK